MPTPIVMLLPEELTGGTTIINNYADEIMVSEPENIVTTETQEDIKVMETEYPVLADELVETIDVTEGFIVNQEAG